MSKNTSQDDLLPQAVKTLLLLRGESLMSACAKASERSQNKVDYGNASSWLRGVPGRLGITKLNVLLDYLGIKNDRLDTMRIHLWTLPRLSDKQKHEDLLELLRRYAALPKRALWLLTPQKAPRGLAIEAGGVSIVLLPSNSIRQDELHNWLTALPQACTLLDERLGMKSTDLWDDLLHERKPPQQLWQIEPSANDHAWQNLIEVLKAREIAPEDVLVWVEQGANAQKSERDASVNPADHRQEWDIDAEDWDSLFKNES